MVVVVVVVGGFQKMKENQHKSVEVRERKGQREMGKPLVRKRGGGREEN